MPEPSGLGQLLTKGGDLRCIGSEGSSILQRFAALIQIALTGHVTRTPIQGHGHGNHHAEGQQR